MLRGLGSTLRIVELELDESIRIKKDSGRMLIASISTMTALQTLKLSMQDHKLSLSTLINLFETLNCQVTSLEVAVISINRSLNAKMFPLFCSNLR